MPFQRTSIKSLTEFAPDGAFDSATDRLQVEFENGESVILMYENRNQYIKNPALKTERFWLDHRRSPLNFSPEVREQLTPQLDECHAGFCALLVTGHLLLTVVSQSYLGQFRSDSLVTLVTPVRTTMHTSFTYEEIHPFEPSRRRPEVDS